MISVLLIEDDQVDRQAEKRFVRTMPSEIALVEAATAADGIALAEAKHFDCVLLD